MNINETHSANQELLRLNVCASNECDFSEVQAVSTPESSDRWHPVAHDALVNQFRESIGNTELEIVNEHHSLHRYGQRYFGLFQVKGVGRKHGDEVGTVMCLRNSHDKAFRAGISAGDAPFVCSNLIFSNEIVLGRRHTTNIMRDLPQIIARAIGQLMESWTTTDKRIDAYKLCDIDDRVAHDLILRGFQAGACGKTQIADIFAQWHKPQHENFEGRDLWSLQNAFTNVWRGNTLNTANRSSQLYSVLDTFAACAKPAEVIEVGELVLNAS
jgi:hypothetical protein